MTRNAETPPALPRRPRNPPSASASPAVGAERPHSGPVAELASRRRRTGARGLPARLRHDASADRRRSSCRSCSAGACSPGRSRCRRWARRVLAPPPSPPRPAPCSCCRPSCGGRDSRGRRSARWCWACSRPRPTVGAALLHAGVVRGAPADGAERPPRRRRSPATPPVPARSPGSSTRASPYPGIVPRATPAAVPGRPVRGRARLRPERPLRRQYGVPGYPPPPPVGAPGLRPVCIARSEAPTAGRRHRGAGRHRTTAAGHPAGDRARRERGRDPGAAVPAGRGGSGLGTPTARCPDPGTTAFRSDAATAPARTGEPDTGTGSFRRLAGTGSYPAVPERPGIGHRLATGSVGHGLGRRGSSGRWPAADPPAPADSDGSSTRTMPAVPDDKR